MPDDVTVKDSAEGAAPPATGTDAPASAPSGGEAGTTGAAAAPEGFSEEFLKTLDITDPASLPQGYRERIEKPFKAYYTRKYQELAEERRRFDAERQATFEAVRRVMDSAKNAPSGPTPREARKAELSELAASGDKDAYRELARMEAEDIVAPMQTQNTLKSAVETAQAFSPYVREGFNQIVETIKTDPKLNRLANMNNHEFADTVMIGLGLEREVLDLRPKYKGALQEIEALKAKITSMEKERVSGLPSSTSKAGTTSGSPARASRSAAEQDKEAWVASGGRPEDYR